MVVTNNWTTLISVPAGKSIVIRLSKQYVWLAVQINGSRGELWEQTVFGTDEEIVIPVEVPDAICTPMLSFKTFVPGETLQIEYEMRDRDTDYTKNL